MTELPIELSDKVIVDLFGSEAAESESINRLKEYFYKNNAYNRFKEELPLRVLVGPKGTGKSAIFRYALAEAEDCKLPHFNMPEENWPSGQQYTATKDATADWVTHIYKFIVQKYNVSDKVKVDASFIRDVGNRFVPFIMNLISSDEAALQSAKQFLNNEVVDLSVKKESLTVYIDNVDSLWSGRPSDVYNICGLMRACHILSSDSIGINIRLSLRSDVYYTLLGELDIMDKVSSNIIKMKWKNHEILCVTAARLARFRSEEFDWEKHINEIDDLNQEQIFSEYFSDIFADKYYGIGKWEKIPMRRALLSFIRQRPRDMILFCSAAARAARKTPINHTHIQNILPQYGSDRINDLVAEYRHELPNISALLANMRATRQDYKDGIYNRYKQNEIIKKLNNILSNTDIRFRGQHAKPKSMDVLRFLHRINFLIATKEDEAGYITRRYFEDDESISRNIESGVWSWEVHMAYRWGLEGLDEKLTFGSNEPFSVS